MECDSALTQLLLHVSDPKLLPIFWCKFLASLTSAFLDLEKREFLSRLNELVFSTTAAATADPQSESLLKESLYRKDVVGIVSTIKSAAKIVQSHRVEPEELAISSTSTTANPVINPLTSRLTQSLEEGTEDGGGGHDEIAFLQSLVAEKERLFADIEGRAYSPFIENVISFNYAVGSRKNNTAAGVALTDRRQFDKAKGAIILQRIFRGYITRKRVRRHALRFLVAREIFETETSYIHTLYEMVRFFKIPLLILHLEGKLGSIRSSSSNNNNLISMSKFIFYRVEDLLANHLTLARRIHERIKKWSFESSCLGDIFTSPKAIDVDLYLEYTTKYNDALALYNTFKDNSTLKGIIQNARQKMQRSSTLDDLLIVPIQRVPRYLLLLKELLKQTPPQHPDITFLETAIAGVHKTVTFINEQKRVKESLASVSVIQERVHGLPQPITGGNRFLVQEENVHEQSLSDASKRKPRRIFIFNDMILVCAPTKRTNPISYDYKWSIFLDACQIGQVELQASEDSQDEADDLQAAADDNNNNNNNTQQHDNDSSKPAAKDDDDRPKWSEVAIGIVWKSAKGSLEKKVIYTNSSALLGIMIETQQRYYLNE